MRKILGIISALAAALLCGISASAATVNIKNEDILSETQLQSVIDYASDVSEETGWNIDIYVTDGIYINSEGQAENYCISSFESDFGHDADGVFFLCDTEWVYLITSGRATDYISWSECEHTARLGNDYYKTDIVKSINVVLDGVRTEYLEGPDGGFDLTKGFLFGVVIGGVIIAAILITVHTTYKTYAKPMVNNYLNAATLNFGQRRDVFITRTVTSHTVSSGSHGGHGGGGGHHGGGGRR